MQLKPIIIVFTRVQIHEASGDSDTYEDPDDPTYCPSEFDVSIL
jgi:hypothetical protein